jgi:hypothetical protein
VHPQTSKSTFASIAKGVEQSGGGLVTLRVEGMKGIYYFCAAVVLSIVLSLVVDLYEIRAGAAARGTRSDQQQQQPYLRLETQDDGHDDLVLLVDQQDLQELPQYQDVATMFATEATTTITVHLYKCLAISLASLTAACVALAILSQSLDRTVGGATRYGSGGGMGSLIDEHLYAVFGARTRRASCHVPVGLSLSSDTLSTFWHVFLATIDFMGAFCAWEGRLLCMGSHCLGSLFGFHAHAHHYRYHSQSTRVCHGIGGYLVSMSLWIQPILPFTLS